MVRRIQCMLLAILLGGLLICPVFAASYSKCDVRIACVNGQTVNLYDNPGDTSRVTYFSKGQTVTGTMCATLSDGSTWYRVSATHKGVDTMFWLKYESSKMTVTPIDGSSGSSITYASCNVRIDCVNGQIVNLYSKPGDTSRVTYFSKGQSVKSTYCAALDGSIWYRVNATHQGTDMYFWLKYESSKMTVTVINSGPYTVSFNANGGSVSPSQKVTDGSTYGTLPTPTRSGYTFDGWYTAANGGSRITESSIITGDITLYAHWAVEQSGMCTIRFDANGGIRDYNASIKVGYKYGSLPTPTRSGYTFDGWYTATNGGSRITESSTVTGDITLYAHWTSKDVTITLSFNANGGQNAPSAYNGNNYLTVQIPNNIPTRSGYAFKGWAINKNATRADYQPGDVITIRDNTILYAVWESTQKTCTSHKYTSAGGDYCTVCGYKFEPTIKPLDIEVYAVKDNVPIRDNYYAENSKITGNLMKDKGVHVTGSLVNSVGRTWYVIKAGDREYYVYSENVTTTKPTVTTYTITYNANGGKGAPSSSKGINITIPSSTVPTRTGYIFLGYAESATAKTPTYALGQKFVATRNITLYAVWAASPSSNVTPEEKARMDAVRGCPQHYTYYVNKKNVGTVDKSKKQGEGLCTSCAPTTLIQRMETRLTGMESTFTFDEFRSSGGYAWSPEGTYTGGTPKHSYTFTKETLARLGSDTAAKINTLKTRLDEHPEGVIVYCNYGGSYHAIVLTDYSGNQFYACDPADRNLTTYVCEGRETVETTWLCREHLKDINGIIDNLVYLSYIKAVS